MEIKKNTMLQWEEFLAHIQQFSKSSLKMLDSGYRQRKVILVSIWDGQVTPPNYTLITFVDQLAGSALSSPWVNPLWYLPIYEEFQSSRNRICLKLLFAYQGIRTRNYGCFWGCSLLRHIHQTQRVPAPVSDLDLTFLPGLDLLHSSQLGFPGVLTLCLALLFKTSTFLPLFRGDA